LAKVASRSLSSPAIQSFTRIGPGWTRLGTGLECHGSILLKRSASVDGVGRDLLQTRDQDEPPQSDLDDRHKFEDRNAKPCRLALFPATLEFPELGRRQRDVEPGLALTEPKVASNFKGELSAWFNFSNFRR